IKTKAMTVNRHELDQIKAFVEGLGTQFRLSTVIYPRLNGDLTPATYRLSPDEIVALECQAGEPEERCTEAESQIGPPADDRLFRCGCGTTAKQPVIRSHSETAGHSLAGCFAVAAGRPRFISTPGGNWGPVRGSLSGVMSGSSPWPTRSPGCFRRSEAPSTKARH